jgi:cyclic beta-1,2-glucan synthetase
LTHEGTTREGGGDRTAHVGFYLIDKGLAQLERAVKLRRSPLKALRRVTSRFPLLLYVGTIMLVTASITGGFLAKAQADGLSGWILGLIVILSLMGASHLAIDRSQFQFLSLDSVRPIQSVRGLIKCGYGK